MATTTTNYGWDIPQSTDLVKDGATAIATLGQDIDTTFVDLKGGTTGQILSKASNTDNDYAWVTPNPGDITGVTAGTGITGGGTSGDVTVNFDVANYGGGQYAAGKNRIINGAMEIDQRNNGSAVTIAATSNTYTLDRWVCNWSQSSKASVQRVSSSAPAGFTYSMKITSLSAYTVGSGDYFPVQQGIELINISDLAWGTASAKSAVLSFWVRSSITGTHGGAIKNANNGASYSFPFTYTISAANTWEYKTVSITAPTAGTWTDMATVCFSMGMGSTFKGTAGSWASANYLSATGAVDVLATNGATWQVTGVQFEQGSTATPFQRAAGNIQGELAACQRYYWRSSAGTNDAYFGSGQAGSSTEAYIVVKHAQTMRVKPTSIDYSTLNLQVITGSYNVTAASLQDAGTDTTLVKCVVASGLTSTTQTYMLRALASGPGYLGLSAEL